MKKLILIAAAFLLTGCSTMTPQERAQVKSDLTSLVNSLNTIGHAANNYKQQQLIKAQAKSYNQQARAAASAGQGSTKIVIKNSNAAAVAAQLKQQALLEAQRQRDLAAARARAAGGGGSITKLK